MSLPFHSTAPLPFLRSLAPYFELLNHSTASAQTSLNVPPCLIHALLLGFFVESSGYGMSRRICADYKVFVVRLNAARVETLHAPSAAKVLAVDQMSVASATMLILLITFSR